MIKIGIIGFGYMGHFHYEKAGHFDDVKVVAAFDVNEDNLAEAKELGMETFDNLDEFLKEDMDLVVVATPNQWHAPYSIAAMKAGKHVLCEKPATMSVAEIEDIIKVSEETGKMFTVHQQRRFDKDYRALCEVIRSGEIGNVTTIESKVLGERGVCFGWRGDPESGGGMLYDWGVHLIDQLLQLYPDEKVVSIYARIMSILTPAVDDSFEINMKFSNGVCAKVTVTTFALEKLPRWYVFGDRGTLRIENIMSTEGRARRIKGDVQGFDSVVGKKNLGPSRTMAPLKPEFIEEIEIPDLPDMTMEYWTNLIDAVKGNAEPHVKPEQILRQMKIVEASFESAEKNEVVKETI
ncbi:MAG: Gfo/Idh/MocA family oxidoreductase [Clostridiales bacterium]|nr:Gfo/Idh/MocA family oxidoreductase [Clostridiales bacterium]